MKTFSAKAEKVEHDWYVVDAEGKALGRLATEIAHRLRGKHKPEYTPHVDTGDYIVVINAEKVKVTGNKDIQKKYYRHSGYPGGLKSSTFSEIIEKNPQDIILKAVKGMLPKNKLSNSMISKLKVYKGENHPHIGQNPHKIDL